MPRTKEPFLSISASKARGWQRPRGCIFLAVDSKGKKQPQTWKMERQRVWGLKFCESPGGRSSLCLSRGSEGLGAVDPESRRLATFLQDKHRDLHFPTPAMAKKQEKKGQIGRRLENSLWNKPFVSHGKGAETYFSCCPGWSTETSQSGLVSLGGGRERWWWW